MSIFTRDKVWFSADRRTYWEYDPGAGDAALFVEGTEVLTATPSGVTLPVGVSASGAVAVAGRLSAVAGLSWSVSTGGAASSTISLDTVVSILGATDTQTYVLAAPSSAGIVKVLANVDLASTLHIDFTTGVLVEGFSTASVLNLLPGARVGLVSLSTISYMIMFPTTVATALVTTLTT